MCDDTRARVPKKEFLILFEPTNSFICFVNARLCASPSRRRRVELAAAFCRGAAPTLGQPGDIPSQRNRHVCNAIENQMSRVTRVCNRTL